MMRCAYCGQERSVRDGFPIPTYAECWPCYWNRHVAEAHPKRWWQRRARFGTHHAGEHHS